MSVHRKGVRNEIEGWPIAESRGASWASCVQNGDERDERCWSSKVSAEHEDDGSGRTPLQKIALCGLGGGVHCVEGARAVGQRDAKVESDECESDAV